LPRAGTALLALSGRGDALRRWQQALGPADPAVAAVTDPGSVHALYGAAAGCVVTASYDTAGAAREMAVLFGGSEAALAPASPAALSTAPSPLSPPASAAATAAAAAATSAISGLAPSGAPQGRALAWPVAEGRGLADALWCVQHLLWAGAQLRGLLLRAPAPAAATAAAAPASAALLADVALEEPAAALPAMLAAAPPPPLPAAAAANGAASAPNPSPAAQPSAAPPSELHALPSFAAAEALLEAAAAPRGAAPGSSAGASPFGEVSFASSAAAAAAPSSAGPSLHPHHGEEQLVAVALQSRGSPHAAAALLAALAAHVTCGGPYGDGTSSGTGGRLEVVAVRHVRQLPAEVAHALTSAGHVAVQLSAAPHAPHTSGGAAGSRPASAFAGHAGGPPTRLAQGQATLLAVLHGPAAQSRVAALLAAAAGVLSGADGAAAAEPGGRVADDDGEADAAAWAARLRAALRPYGGAVGVAAASPGLLAAASGSQASARRALAYAFRPDQVVLDPGFHDGLSRAPLTAPGCVPLPAPAEPLPRLLAGPERLRTVVGMGGSALSRNLLPRLIKLLWREGYALHAAATLTPEPGSALAAALPALAGQPSVVLAVSRSNAVSHARALAAGLCAALAAPPGRASLSGGAASAGPPPAVAADAPVAAGCSWAAAADAAREVVAAAAVPPVAAEGGAAADGGATARRFVRPDGCRLLQLTSLVATPQLESMGESLQWMSAHARLPARHSPGLQGFRSSCTDRPYRAELTTCGAHATTMPLLVPQSTLASSSLKSLCLSAELDWACLADALEALHGEGFRLAALRAAATEGRPLAALAGRAGLRLGPAQVQVRGRGLREQQRRRSHTTVVLDSVRWRGAAAW
jgi:hypothetical protein